MKPSLTIIIPARYEEKVIVKTLRKIKHQVRTKHHIIVVNDSDEADRTGAVAKKYALSEQNVKVYIYRKSPSPSFAKALSLGFCKTKSVYVVPVMADLCDDIQDIDIMYNKMLEGWDIVCASRYMPGGKKTGGPFLQSLFSHIVCLTLKVLTGIATHDVSNAFKMYKKKMLNSLLIDEASGVELSMALALQAHFNGARITQIPTHWAGRTVGYSKFKMVERTPRYSKIYFWALKMRIRQLFS